MTVIPVSPGVATPRSARRGLRTWLRRYGPWLVVAIALGDLLRRSAINANLITLGPFTLLAPATATAFILLGLSLRLGLWNPQVRRRSQAGLALATLALCMVLPIGFGHLTGQAPAWEDWIGRHAVATAPGLNPGVPHMSAQSVVFFLLSIFSLTALHSPLARRPAARDAGIAVSLLVELFALVSIMSYAAGNPPLRPGGLVQMGPLVTVEFALFHLLLLFGDRASERIREWFFGKVVGTGEPEPVSREERLVLRLGALIGTVAVAVGIIYLRVETAVQQERALAALVTLTDLKVRQVEQWRRERVADARTLRHLPLLAESVTGPSSRVTSTELAEWMRAFVGGYRYSGMMVFNAQHETIAAEPSIKRAELPDLDQRLRALGLDSGVIEVPPYLGPKGELHWDLIVPLRRRDAPALAGAIWLRADPARHVLPLLESWPTDYKTGQSSLWIQRGDEFVSLSGQVGRAVAPAAEQKPMGTVRRLSDLPPESLPARILRGELVAGEGTDVRGVPILGIIRPIEGTTWRLTSRVDSAEAYAPLRRQALIVAGILTGLLATTGGAMGWLWRQRQRNLVHDRAVAELEQKRTAARFGAVMHEARDIIMIVDEDMRVIDANDAAAQAFGWTREELRTKRIQDLRAPETLANLPAIVDQTRSDGGAFFETVYRRRDGTMFPAEASVRNVVVDGKAQSVAIIRDITERRKAEADLRASEERYRLIAENTSDVIWLYDFHTQGFTYVSASVAALLGFQPEEMLGAPLTGTLTETSAAQAAAALQQLQAGLSAGGAAQHVVIELDQRRKDGTVVPTEVVASLLPAPVGAPRHILGISRNITERRRAQATLRQFNTELEQQVKARTAELAARNNETQALLEAMPDTVLLCDEKGAIISARSVRYPAVVGLVTGRPAEGRIPLVDQAVLEITGVMHAAALAAGETVVREFERPLNETEMFWLDARATAIGNGRVLILLREITERKRLERAMQGNLEREKQLSEMKSQFISVASHEFRTPLAAAVGSLELLERHAAKVTETKRAELLTRIQRSLGRLTTIMNDVLQVSRADSGRVKVKRMEVDLVQFVRDIIHDIEAGDRQQHRFTFEVTGGPNVVPVDTNLVNHILSNLLGNAVRYSPAGTQVSVQLGIDAEAFVVTVADQGIGIPEAERERVFEPFARGSNVGQIAGTGLGLNIVKRYVELMGGEIALLPSARGALFRVSIPLHQPVPVS